jgi:hypothetical protein
MLSAVVYSPSLVLFKFSPLFWKQIMIILYMYTHAHVCVCETFLKTVHDHIYACVHVYSWVCVCVWEGGGEVCVGGSEHHDSARKCGASETFISVSVSLWSYWWSIMEIFFVKCCLQYSCFLNAQIVPWSSGWRMLLQLWGITELAVMGYNTTCRFIILLVSWEDE